MAATHEEIERVAHAWLSTGFFDDHYTTDALARHVLRLLEEIKMNAKESQANAINMAEYTAAQNKATRYKMAIENAIQDCTLCDPAHPGLMEVEKGNYSRLETCRGCSALRTVLL